MAIPSLPAEIAPTKAIGGFNSCTVTCAGCAGEGAAISAEGRLDREKIGRSLVDVNDANGIVQSGLACRLFGSEPEPGANPVSVLASETALTMAFFASLAIGSNRLISVSAAALQVSPNNARLKPTIRYAKRVTLI